MYPEHEKLKALNGANNTVGDFLTWLGEQGMTITEYDEDDPDERYFPVRKTKEEFIAEFFNISPQKLEEEKQAMLATLRGEK